ncbi:acetyl-CoA carboxylase carboxyltransferase subunit alpha [Erysipelothrix urinaevulpis]
MNPTIKRLEKEIKLLKKDNLDTSHLEKSLGILKQEIKSKMSAWDHVQMARDLNRYNTKEVIASLFDDFIELHGDRYFGDDKAIYGGIAFLGSLPVTVIGINKGTHTQDNIEANFGMVHPEGYRKTLRLMKQAEKFNRPIITFINTPGAYPGVEAEERGQGEAIAQNLMQMMELSVPTISIILGEAGSGGALALAVTDQVWMLENAIYCILSPEGFASILLKDASKASDAAESMKITSKDMLQHGIVDEIIYEDKDFEEVTHYMKQRLITELDSLSKLKSHRLKKLRYDRFRKFGDVIHEH